jgi:hypothetical protein
MSAEEKEDPKSQAAELTPEQLLKTLELQLEFARKQRTESQGIKKQSTLAMLILTILGGVMLFFLTWMLERIRQEAELQESPTQVVDRQK